jgi:hypothetical protein
MRRIRTPVKVQSGPKPHLLAVYKRLRYDERALSSLITVAGILAIIIMVISAILNTLVPQWAKEDESKHMEEELSNYLGIRVSINNLIELSDFDYSLSPRVRLGASGNIPIGVIPSTGKLTFYPFDNSTSETVTRLHDPLSIYSKGGGNIEYKANNFYYQDQTIVYEHGAVVLSQTGGAVMEAGPLLTVTKNQLLNDTKTYGFFDPGTKDDPSEARFVFPGRFGNVTLNFEAFDVDTEGEVLVKLNRKVVASVPVTGDENWSAPVTVNLTNLWVKDFSQNILEFNQTSGVSGEEWGVRNVTLSGNHSAIDLTMVTLVGNKEDIGGRDSHTIKLKLMAHELNTYEWPGENLTLNFTTKYPDAWETYLNNLLNNTGSDLQWSSDPTSTDYRIVSNIIPQESQVADDTHMVTLIVKNVNKFDCTIAIVRVDIG